MNEESAARLVVAADVQRVRTARVLVHADGRLDRFTPPDDRLVGVPLGEIRIEGIRRALGGRDEQRAQRDAGGHANDLRRPRRGQQRDGRHQGEPGQHDQALEAAEDRDQHEAGAERSGDRPRHIQRVEEPDA